MENEVVTLITNATALGVLAGVLYFSFRLLDRTVEILARHSERLDQVLADLVDHLTEVKN